MRYGYARVSTVQQKTDPQRAALKAANCDHIFTDHGKTGKNTKRPEWQKCFSTLRAGDTLVVWKIDRLARSLHDLLGIIKELEKRGVIFESVTQKIDTSSPFGRAFLQMIGLFAEFEASLLQERADEGRADRRRRGGKFGPKFSLDAQQIAHARQQIAEGKTLRHMAEDVYHVDRTTLWRALQR